MGLDSCSCLHCKARSQRIEVGIGVDLGAIDIEFLAPDQLLLLALFYDCVEEAAEHLYSIALTDAGQARMIGQGLTHIIAQIPQNAEPVCRMAHQLAFRAYPLKKHDELQFEEHHRLNGRTTTVCIGLMHQLAHTREIKRSLQMAIEVIPRHQVLKGYIDERHKVPLFSSHHSGSFSPSHNDT